MLLSQTRLDLSKICFVEEDMRGDSLKSLLFKSESRVGRIQFFFYRPPRQERRFDHDRRGPGAESIELVLSTFAIRVRRTFGCFQPFRRLSQPLFSGRQRLTRLLKSKRQ